MWLFTQLYNINARKTIRIQSKRMQYYLASINNDIVWGAEDQRDDYYAIMMSKIPFVLQSADSARNAISLLNFIGKRKAILTQLDEIQSGMEDMLLAVSGNDTELEKLQRLQLIASKYQTEASNILLIRAEYLEKLSYSFTIKSALSSMKYDDNNIEKIESLLCKRNSY